MNVRLYHVFPEVLPVEALRDGLVKALQQAPMLGGRSVVVVVVVIVVLVVVMVVKKSSKIAL